MLVVFGACNGRKQAVKDHYAKEKSSVAWNKMEDSGLVDTSTEMY